MGSRGDCLNADLPVNPMTSKTVIDTMNHDPKLHGHLAELDTASINHQREGASTCGYACREGVQKHGLPDARHLTPTRRST
jgi:hypothetical protein